MKKFGCLILLSSLLPMFAAETTDHRLDYICGEHEPYRKFFDTFTNAVAKADKKAVASLVNYPLMVNRESGTKYIKSPAALIQNYDAVFTENVRHEIAIQTYDALFVNWQGVMIGRGQVWFEGICSGIITNGKCENVTVNVVTINQDAPRTDWLSYEPAVVEVTGVIKRQTFPGPPEYESVAKGDEAETCWILHLSQIVCVKADGIKDSINDETEAGITELQLNLDEDQYAKYKKLVGKHVKVTGTLYHSINGHHHTTVLLTVKSIEPLDGKTTLSPP